MAGINLDFAFDRTSVNPIDSSLVLTKAEMLAINDNLMPDTYFAVCKDDKKFYIYDKSATPSAETGKFTELKGGGGGEEGKTYTMDWDESTHELTLTDGTTPQNLELTGLQGELTAGDNISIVEDPYTGTTVISSTGGGSTYTAGNGIDITNDVISADIKTINSSAITGSGNLTTGKVISDYQTNSVSIYEGTDNSVQISKVDNDTLRVQGYGVDDRDQTQTLYDMNLTTKGYVDGKSFTIQGNSSGITNTFDELKAARAAGKQFYFHGSGGNVFSVLQVSLETVSGEEQITVLMTTYNGKITKYVIKADGTQTVEEVMDYSRGNGVNYAVGKETWYGTYTDENNVTYQTYSKTIFIPALPSAAGITTYPIGVSNMKQIIDIFGTTTDGFKLNAPRQTASDNITIYQVSKGSQTFSIEVGKDRSNKSAYVTIIYAKNN